MKLNITKKIFTTSIKILSFTPTKRLMMMEIPETPPVTKLFLDKNRLKDSVDTINPKKNVMY